MVGQLKQARPVHRSGAPALGGAEQKPLQQVAGQGRAVLRNKGLPAPRSTVVDALGEQLDLVFSGEKDLDSALKDAQAIGEKAMEEARNN